MKICNFTQAELDTLRKECNFTDLESQCFELKAKDCTDVQLAVKLNISESTAAVTMRRVRSKITTVLEKNAKHFEEPSSCSCGKSCFGIVAHTMTEWGRIPDFLSRKGTLYIYTDYRTDNDINIPRIKIGDGVSPLSEIPFATMSITDEDMEYWDNKPDTARNDFGRIVFIDDTYFGENRFIFPCDGYVTLKFNTAENAPPDHAKVKIYGSSGKLGFMLSKHTDRDDQSKEVYVRKGMQCEYVQATKGAEIMFVPLV